MLTRSTSLKYLPELALLAFSSAERGVKLTGCIVHPTLGMYNVISTGSLPSVGGGATCLIASSDSTLILSSYEKSFSIPYTFEPSISIYAFSIGACGFLDV